MITNLFRVILLVGILLYILLIIYLMKKGRMSLKYSLVWFLTGLVLLICAAFPQLIGFATGLLGIYSEVNGVFFVGVCFILLIILSLTSIVSGLSERLRTLVQTQGMLEKRVRELEEKLSAMENK
ncbi:MAG: DUF2304 domain-containing protein [Lachnospiraceae bacterium]|nr:DUF2304 domain-containing protein [Lachnospiraceae bacterium]MBQ9935609.1 DUF2304 domain-containing protein [Lachnospiraceae bacterium]